MSYETILLDIHGQVGLITLNRPQALNALNAQLIGEVNHALDTLEADNGIGCIVITGSKKSFAAGADIKEMADKGFPQIYLDDFFAAADRIAARRKPIIAAVVVPPSTITTCPGWIRAAAARATACLEAICTLLRVSIGAMAADTGTRAFSMVSALLTLNQTSSSLAVVPSALVKEPT